MFADLFFEALVKEKDDSNPHPYYRIPNPCLLNQRTQFFPLTPQKRRFKKKRTQFTTTKDLRLKTHKKNAKQTQFSPLTAQNQRFTKKTKPKQTQFKPNFTYFCWRFAIDDLPLGFNYQMDCRSIGKLI